MAQISSEDSLEKILNILDTMVQQQQEKKEKESSGENKTDKDLTSLLSGVIDNDDNKTAASAGQQLESLAKGLKAIAEIDEKTIETVSTSLGHINKIIKELDIPKEFNLSIDQFVKAIELLDQIDEETASKLVNFIEKLHLENLQDDIKNTEAIVGIIQALTYLTQTDLSKLSTNLNNLKESDAEKLGKFIGKLIVSLKKSLKNLNSAEIIETLKPLGELFYGLSAIVNTNIFKMKISLNPLEGYLVGRQIGQFLHAIMKRIKDDKVDKSVQYIGNILGPLATFADKNNNKSSIYALRKALSTRNAKKIAKFFNTLVSGLPDKKESAEAIGTAAAAITTLTQVGIWGSIKFRIFVSTFTEKRAQKINNFFRTLISGDWDESKLKNVQDFMQSFTKLLKSMTFILVILIAVVAFAPIEAVIGGYLLMKMTINLMKKTITDIIKGSDKKKIDGASDVIKSIALLILTIAGVIGMITILTVLVGPEPVIFGFAIIGLLLVGVTFMIKSLTAKNMKKGLADAAKVLKGVALLILAATAAIAILAIVMAATKIEYVLIGFAIIGVLMIGAYFMIKKLSSIKSKNLKEATSALLKISAAFAIIAITALLFKYIGNPKTLIATVLGALVVTLVVAAGIGMVLLLQKHGKNKKLNEATKTLVIITAIMAAVALITKFIIIPIGEDVGAAFKGALVVVGTLALLIGGVFLLSKITSKKSQLQNNIKALAILTLLYAGLSLLIKFIIIPIGEELGAALKGSLAVVLTLALLIGGVYLLSSIDSKKQKLKNNVKALAILSLIYAGLGILIKFIIIPIGEEFGSALKGSLAVLATLAALIGGLYLLSQIKMKKMGKALLYVAGLGLIYAALGLLIKFLIIPIGEQAKEALFGTLITIGTLAALIGGIWLLSQIDMKNMGKAAIYMVVMGFILLGLSLIVKELIIPIGEQAKEALFGSLLVLGLVLVFGAIMMGIGFLLGIKKVQTAMIKGAIFMAAVGVILWILGKGVKSFAKSAKEVWELNGNNLLGPVIYGGLLIVGIISVMGLIMFGIGKFLKLDKIITIIIGGVVANIIGVLAALIAGEMWLFSKAAADIYHLNEGGAVLLGGGIIILILGVMTTIMALMGGPLLEVGVLAIIGGVVIDVIGGLADILAGEIWLICKMARSVFDMNKDGGLEKGFDLMLLTVAKMAEIAGAMALLALAIPAAVLGSLAALFIIPIIGATSLIVSEFISIFDKLMDKSESQLQEAADKIIFLYDLLYDIVKAAAPGFMDGIRLLTSVGAVGPLLIFFTFLDEIVDKIIDINSKITKEILLSFRGYIVGKDEDDHECLLGTFKDIVQGFYDMGIFTTLLAQAIAKFMRPIIETISQWVDVVIKVATMSYVTGFDDNGNPEYEHLDPNVFGEAAHNVTTGFNEFVSSLNEGFKELSPFRVWVIGWMCDLMEPIIETVGDYVDVIMKVATGVYPISVDEKGNVEYEHLEPEDFGKAANQVTDSFLYFVEQLGIGFGNLSEPAIDAIEDLDDNMGPIMEAVGAFVDAVIKVATLNIVVGYDDKGHPKYEKIEIAEFEAAAETVCKYFARFISDLSTNFKAMGPDVVDAIEDLDDNLMPIMQAVGSFVDAIMKLKTGTYIKAKHADGSIEYGEVTTEDFGEAAETVVDNFSYFIKKLGKLEDAADDCEDVIDDLLDDGGIGGVMEAVGSFASAIAALATGTYVDHYENDENGKPTIPIYKTITRQQIKDAAVTLTDTFMTFITTLANRFSSDDMKKKVESALDAMSGGVEDVMKGVKTFADTLSTISSIKTTVEQPDGTKTEELICMDPEAPRRLATNVANAFVDFITIIADAFTGEETDDMDIMNSANKKILEKYKALAQVSVQVNKAMGNIKEIITAFVDVLKLISDNSDIGQAPDELADTSDMSMRGSGGMFGMMKSRAQSGGNKNKITFESAPMYAMIVCTAIKAYIDMFNDTNFPYTTSDLEILRNRAKGATKYFEKLEDTIETYTDVIDVVAYVHKDPERADKILGWVEGITINTKALTKVLEDDIFDYNNIKKLRSRAVSVETFLDYLQDVLKEYNNLIKKLDDEPEETKQYIDGFATNLPALTQAMITANNDTKDINLSSLLDIMPDYIKVAKQYKRLTRYLNVQEDLTQGIQNFVKNIKVLTDSQVTASMAKDVHPIRKYANTLKIFATEISNTTKSVKLYVSSMEKAKKAMESLDKQIIDKSDKRNKALDALSDRIEKISEAVFVLTEAVYQMSDAFDYINESDILSMFKSTQDLVEKVTGIKNDEESGLGSGTGTDISSDRTPRPRPSRTMSSRPGAGTEPGGAAGGSRTTLMDRGMGRSGTVIFEFKDVNLYGSFRTR